MKYCNTEVNYGYKVTINKDNHFAICKLLWIRTGGYSMDKNRRLHMKSGLTMIIGDGYATKQYEQDTTCLS